MLLFSESRFLVMLTISIVLHNQDAFRISNSGDGSCHSIRPTNDEFLIANRVAPRTYNKYTEAYGIPVLALNKVHNIALTVACYELQILLADRSDLRRRVLRKKPIVEILPLYEKSNRTANYCWLFRPHAVGPSHGHHTITVPEENLICNKRDRFNNEDVTTHMLVHALDKFTLRPGYRDFHSRIKNAHRSAKRRGLWKNTYGYGSAMEYLPEITQSFFGVNNKLRSQDNFHNGINSQEGLKKYDGEAFDILKDLFPCNNTMIDRCKPPTKDAVLRIKMDCTDDYGNGVPPTVSKMEKSEIARRPTTSSRPGKITGTSTKKMINTTALPTNSEQKHCVDTNIHCKKWGKDGKCASDRKYMRMACMKTCKTCEVVNDTTLKRPTGCYDKLPIECKEWAKEEACKQKKLFMRHVCKKTCYACDIEDCADTVKECPLWTKHGECKRNPQYMLYYCMKSCGSCKTEVFPLRTPTVCQDMFAAACDYWRKQSKCETHAPYMLRYCERSCGACVI